MRCYQPVNSIGILPSSAAEFHKKGKRKKKKRLRYDWHRGELSCWAVKESGESSCVSQSSHHYFHRKIWVTASVSIIFLVADGAYVQTDAFPKSTLSRSANQRDSDFVASSHRSHAFTLAIIDKDNLFLCSIDVCSIAVADPMWPKTTNQQKLSESIIRCIVYLFFAYTTITRWRLMVQFYAVKPGASHRTDNISVKTPAADPVRLAAKSSLIKKSERLFVNGTTMQQTWVSRRSRGQLIKTFLKIFF